MSFDDFIKLIKKSNGNYKIKTFSFWNKLLLHALWAISKTRKAG
ncbi:MAG: hypothetical protein ACKVOM_08600 [Ferruginibacter sp.]